MRRFLLLALLGLAYGAPSERAGLCEVCHLLVGEVQDLITTGQTQKAITSYVENVCSKLPSEEKNNCHSFAQDNSAIIFNKLAHDLTPHDFCMTLDGVCPSQSQYVVPETEVVNPSANPLECELCKLAVLGIDKLLKQNRSDAAINATLEKFCDGLPDKVAGICHEVEPLVLEALKSGLEPSVACKLATLCSAYDEEGSSKISCDVCHAVIDAIGVKDTGTVCEHQRTCVDDKLVEPVHEVEPVPVVESVRVELGVKNEIECQICKFAVQAVDHVLEENRTSATINQTLMQLCDGLPGELKDSCLNVEPEILNAILSGIDPSKACSFLKICNNEVKGFNEISCDACKETMEAIDGEEGIKFCYKFEDICATESTVQEDIVQEDNIQADAKCDLCEFVVQLLDEVLASGESIAKLNETLVEICKAVPDNLKTICNSLIPQIDNIIAAGVDPKVACEAIEFCPKQAHPATLTVEEKCELCSKLGQALPTELASKIKSGVCNEVCHQRHRRSTFKKLGEMIKNTKVKGFAECELCHVFIRSLDGLVGENKTLEQVNTTFYEICNRLTGQQLIDICFKEAPHLVPILKEGIDPIKTCLEIKLCTAEEKMPRKFIQETVTNVKDKVLPKTRPNDSPLLKAVNKRLAQNVGDVKCELCEAVVEMLDKYIADNATDDQINQTLHQLCSSLPAGQFQDFCMQEEALIMQVIEKGFDPKDTCEKATLCAAPKADKTPKEFLQETVTSLKTDDSSLLKAVNKRLAQNVGDVKCELCEAVVEMLDKYIADNATDDQINQTLQQLCSSLPVGQLQDLCMQEEVLIMQVIDKGLDPKDTCEKATLCAAPKADKIPKEFLQETVTSLKTDDSSLLKAVNKRLAQNVGDVKCELCEAVVEMLDKYIADNATDDQINQTLQQLCSSLPVGQLQDLCMQEEVLIMQVIDKGLDPKDTCEKATLCAAPKDLSVTDVTSDRAFLQYLTQKKEKKVGDIKCDICEGAVELVDKYIEENATVETINQTLQRICSSLPDGAFRDLCISEIPAIMEIVESGGFDPEQVCTAAGICSSTEYVPQPAMDDVILPDVEEEGNLKDLKCTLCEAVIQEIDSLVKDNATIEKLNETIYATCSNLIGALQQLCLQSAPRILNALEDGFDPDEACSKIGLCSSVDDVTVNIAPVKVGDVKCDICELIIEGIDKLVKENATDEKINATIYNACNSLPGTAQKYCLNVAPLIVKTVEGGVEPDQACAAMRLCTSQSEAKVVPGTVKKYGDVQCDICEFLIDEIDKYIGNASASQINDTVYDTCSQLPNALQSLCIGIAPTIVKELENGVDPKEACSKLNLCTSQDAEMEAEPMQEYEVDLKCDVCVFIITEIDKVLADNATDAKINASIYSVCAGLETTLAILCRNFAPDIVRTFESGVEPVTACTLLNICPATEMESEPIAENAVDFKCDICEFLIDEMDKILADNATDARLNASIYSVCGKQSGTLRSICTGIAPGIVKFIEEGADPQTACQVLTLCPTEEMEADNLVISSEYLDQTLDCGDCRRSLQNVYEEVDETKLQNMLLSLCDKMPVTYKPQCERLVNELGGKFIKIVLQRFTPTNMCELARCFENGEPASNGSS